MKNLLNTLSIELQDALNDFKVTNVFVAYNEVNTVSEYDLDHFYIVAIENELIALGHNIEA